MTLRALRNPGRSPRPCGGSTPFEVLGKSIWVERDHVPCLVLMFNETTELYAFVKSLTLCQSYPGLVIFSLFFYENNVSPSLIFSKLISVLFIINANISLNITNSCIDLDGSTLAFLNVGLLYQQLLPVKQ